VNPAFKYLDQKLKVADFTIAQVVAIGVGAAFAVAFALWLSPFGLAMTLFVSSFALGLPLITAYTAEWSGFDLIGLLRCAVLWRREPGRFLPGPGEAGGGYSLAPDPRDAAGGYRGPEPPDLEELWAA
jgi:hypothetical protein